LPRSRLCDRERLVRRGQLAETSFEGGEPLIDAAHFDQARGYVSLLGFGRARRQFELRRNLSELLNNGRRPLFERLRVRLAAAKRLIRRTSATIRVSNADRRSPIWPASSRRCANSIA
jgi:hypothetical protein